ncbi:hypothetical protein [Streptomyces sp. NPDC006668]|uniref:hypothetical protein n=1 Tax=Streptomyces sp. NPDC006668 TaxID=3156903 RepID=UPI0033DF3E6E
MNPVLKGRRPGICSHSQANHTPQEMGNHTRRRPARRQGEAVNQTRHPDLGQP